MTTTTHSRCADIDPAAYLRKHLAPDPVLGRHVGGSWPCPRLVFPSGATGELPLMHINARRVVVLVAPHYEPDVKKTHGEDVARILAATDALAATMPTRFGRPLGKITVTFQAHAQYELTKADAEWAQALIQSVCPVVERWIGKGGGKWCISHAVDPTAMTPRGDDQ